MKRILLALIMICMFAKANIEFTLIGTANESKYGYISGQYYTFKFIVNSQYNGGSGDIFTVGTNHWSQTSIDDANIFKHISSTSFSGEYTPAFPSGGFDGGHYELSVIEEDGYQELWFTADVGEGNTNNIGLFMPDGTGVSDFAVEIVLNGSDLNLDVPYSNSFISPTVWWSDKPNFFSGINNSNSWFDLEVYGPNPGYVGFTPTEIQIKFHYSGPENFKHDFPFGYVYDETDGLYGYIGAQNYYFDTNIYNFVTNIYTNLNYDAGIWHSEFNSSFSNEIANGTFQQQDPQKISTFIDAEAPDNFWGGGQYKSAFLIAAIKGDLILRDGIIIQNYHYYNLSDDPYTWSGNYYVVVDNSTIYTYDSSYEASVADNPLINIDMIMSMSDRIYTIDPIPNLIGVTNTYNFSSNSSYQTRAQLMNTIQLLENQASILSNDYVSLENELSVLVAVTNSLQNEITTLEALTNESSNAEAQLTLINNIVNIYQSQINTLEEELETIYEYTNRMTITEAQDAMRDLRVGSQTFGVSNGNATIRMYVDESSDLTSTWSNTQHVLELDIPADADTKFYRFRMD